MPNFARRIFDFVKESRHQQDNEQWHLLILEEMTQKKGIKENFFLFLVLPQIMAFFYYQISWLLYVIKPSWSYALNADFEDHAEHEYMRFVNEHSEFENEPFESEFKEDYVPVKNVADLFRRIARRLKVSPETCFVVGDQLDRDIAPAREAGMKTIYFPGGFHPEWAPAVENVLPDASVSSFLEVCQTLKARIRSL